jgi:signal transduction histidine kinase/tetratricopeptide (TPR) repeat protein
MQAASPSQRYYDFTEKLGESLQAQVYKGYRKDQPEQLLVLKLLKLLSGRKDQSRYLKQKIERLKVLHDPRVCTPLLLETDGGRQIIVQPWFAGQTLDDWAACSQKLRLNDFFSLACTLADILQAVHDAGVTHGGIKPHNILVQPGTLTVRLTDFITPLDIRDVSHFIYDADFVRGTLAYTSPEQTGRINHRVDFSTDLYSLGIVFYELLTGCLPFFSTDPLELIHSHLAEEAPGVHEINAEVPPQLGHVVAKLLLKEPEKRYQSAAGLLADLRRCRDEYAALGHIAAFPIGLYDRSKRVIFISKMVGRETEAELILREYAEVVEGNFRSLFISGLSGIGKTRLIQELQKPLVRRRGYFTSGKFDQYQKNIPYSSLIQALRNLMRTFLTESDARLAQWQERILAAVGREGRVISDVVPELEFIIGAQPEVAHLPPVEARNRFNNLFGGFLASLAGCENPLVLFIDDLQWCDAATFDFLQNIFANQNEHPYLFFIGAYRHNEVDASHPLTKLLRNIKERRGPLREIRLEALSAADCHEMVAYILDSPPDTTANLAQFVAQLTEGNPLFVSESLAWLHNENLLYTDASRHWCWDINKIRDAQMPSTVVELFSSKVRRLPPETLHVIEHCACMGNRFTAEEVARAVDSDMVALFECLKPVLSLSLLLENKSELQFVHDRVQEAVLRQIDADRRNAIHWLVGNRLLDGLGRNADLETADNLFTIAAHLNRGRPHGLDAATAYRLANINFHAGNKALDALAGDAANGFFRSARDYLPADCWNAAYEMTFRIYQRLAKTELMCGRYEASETLVNQLIEQAASDLDKAEALAEQTTSLSSIGNFINAVATANRGLAYFDKAIPEDPEQARRRMQTLMAEIDAQGDVWGKILRMPFTQDRKSKIELAFYSELIPDLYMSGLVPQLYLSAAQSTRHCLAGGMDESVIYSFSIMGLNLGEQEHFELAFRYEDLAHDLCAKYPNTFGATRGMNGIVWCNMHSRSHPAAIAEYCLRGIQCGKNCGDLYNAGLSYGPLMWNLQVQGRDLRLIEEYAQECLHFSRKNQLSFSVGLAEAVLAGWVAPMQSDYRPVPMQETLQRWAADNHVASAGSYFALLGFAQYFLGDYLSAAECLQQVNRYLSGMTDNVLKRLWTVFRILNRLRTSGAEPWAHVETEIAPLLKNVETWSRLGPLLKPYVLFIHAEMARTRGAPNKARNLYLDAVGEAQKQHYVLLAGHGYERLGDLLTETRQGDAALYYAEALRLYRDCHAERKEAMLQERRDASPNGDRRQLAEPPPAELAESATLPDLDVNYLMKSALAISAETDLEQLLRKIMNVVLESSGAQHGYLLVEEQDGLAVAAESHVAQKRVTETRRGALGEAQGVCRGIVNYVLHTHEKVLLRDAGAEGPFQGAAEVRALGLRSILCLPVVKQTHLVGVLYLENRLAADIFTPEKTGMTELLTSHAAISLENARLLQETRSAYQQLRENQERMLQMEKLSALGTLLGGVAHEINNPLMGVMNFVEFAAEKSVDPKSREVLNLALQEIHRIKNIVRNMLIFVRAKPGAPEVCGIRETVRQTLLLLEGDLKKASVEVRLALPEDLPSVACNAGSLQQVLVNLLLNARDALAGRAAPRIDVNARRAGAWVEMNVLDNGAGIPEEVLPNIFDPFFTTKPPGKGTGLGLSVSLRLIGEAGGSLEAYNREDGQGCCMALRFKIAGADGVRDD